MAEALTKAEALVWAAHLAVVEARNAETLDEIDELVAHSRALHDRAAELDSSSDMWSSAIDKWIAPVQPAAHYDRPMSAAEKLRALEPTLMHPWERAGLGKAPFRFVGSHVSLFQAVPGDPNCPVKPGSSCDYCAQAISLVCVIRDANGREFKVGCDCVKRLGEKKLSARADKARLEHERSQRKARAEASRCELAEMLNDPAVVAVIGKVPHPHAEHADRGETLLGWARWMSTWAGASGRQRAVSAIRKATGKPTKRRGTKPASLAQRLHAAANSLKES